MSEERKGVELQAGKVYTLNNFRPEETEIVILPKSGVDVIALAGEIQTIAKYAKDQQSFSDMVMKALNTALTANIAFPKVEIVELDENVTEEQAQ